MKIYKKLYIVLASALFIITYSHAYYSEMIVFGDSLSANGNNFYQYGYWQGGGRDYPYGRYTNGEYVWVEHLAAFLDLPQPMASEAGGTNFAYGGAEIGFSCEYCQKLNVGDQIESCLARYGRLDHNPLIVLWAGGNNFIHGQFTSVGQISRHIERLVQAGGRNFVIPNMPALGYIPALDLEYYDMVDSIMKNSCAGKWDRQVKKFINNELDPEMAIFADKLWNDFSSEITHFLADGAEELLGGVLENFLPDQGYQLNLVPRKEMINLACQFYNDVLEAELDRLSKLYPHVRITRVDCLFFDGVRDELSLSVWYKSHNW